MSRIINGSDLHPYFQRELSRNLVLTSGFLIINLPVMANIKWTLLLIGVLQFQGTSIAQQKENLLSLKAYQKNDTVTVEWSVAKDYDTKEYRIEKSTGAGKFNMVSVIPALGKADVSNYVWNDGQPSQGTNYYRITGNLVNGGSGKSGIISVYIGNNNELFSLYPNPVRTNIFTFNIVKSGKDQFTVKLLNSSGQTIKVYSISHPGGSSSQTLELPASLPNDIYVLNIYGLDRKQKNLKIYISPLK